MYCNHCDVGHVCSKYPQGGSVGLQKIPGTDKELLNKLQYTIYILIQLLAILNCYFIA